MGALSIALVVLASGPEWQKLDSVDGIGVFAREVPNERFYELKLVTSSPLGIDQLCSAAYGTEKVDPDEKPITSVSSRKLIRHTATETTDERITYEQVAPPMVSGRDFAVRTKKEMLPNGGCRLTFSTDNRFAPPLPDGFVRIEKIRGTWEFEAAGAGTRATYTIFTDPNVSLPAGMIQGSLQKTAVYWVQLVLRRAGRSSIGA